MNQPTRFLMTLLVLGTCFNLRATAQSPEKISYQAVIRNSTNQLMVNQTVGLRISILQSSTDGTAVYIETHTRSTNANGLASLEIGGGTVVSGNFNAIDWSEGPYFIKSETDPAGGINYTITGTSQILSVPYALFAEKAGNGFSGNYSDLSNKPDMVTGTNIFLGIGAGKKTTTGIYNIAIGRYALNSKYYFEWFVGYWGFSNV